jgi:hypothetical protein
MGILTTLPPAKTAIPTSPSRKTKTSAYVCVRDANGAVLARMESRQVHDDGVGSPGDIYAGLTTASYSGGSVFNI